MPVRHADPQRDAAACAAIYAPGVEGSFASFEASPPGPEEMALRIAQAAGTYAWLVHETGGEVDGFAYAASHHAREAYRWAVNVAVYVGAGRQGRGVGLDLYGALLGLLARQRLRWACAGIALPNEASVRLHERLGFRPAGVFRSIGYKAGAWRDVGWWQLELDPPGDGAPSEPLGPQLL